ncbi:MAG: hypothetical protein LBL46_03510 [Rickettsiales bacterium]|nr:hypothetical protein [Rickettsiales bacterium]
MKSRKLYAKLQNIAGCLFLAVSCLFLMSVFFSASAFADPIETYEPVQSSARSPRASSRSTARTQASAAGVRGISAGAQSAHSNAPRAGAVPTQGRSTRSRAAVVNATAPAGPATQSRSAVSRGTQARAASARSVAATSAAPAAAPTRGVAQRTSARVIGQRAAATTRTAAAANRAVRARAGVQQATQARVGLSGSAIRASTNNSLSTSLATKTYSSVVDTSTGMISADAYSNCLQSYYTCMDEICTARNPGQRRCACAGRVKTFNQVEQTLQTAKEDLLKVSGELSLLIATKGETIKSAFELTDAEKSLNCVSYRDAYKAANATASNASTAMKTWCDSHLMLDTAACVSTMSTTCNTMYNGLGDGKWMDVLNGADSDILTSLQTYADTLNEVNTFSYNDDANLWDAFTNTDLVVNGSGGLLTDETTSVDRLAQTWGYALYQYAHNNVCGRVLDACFNGIYEACGTRPTEQGGGSGPYNYNSDITITNDGNDIEFVTPKNTNGANTGTAACFGYAASSGDPYATIRRPVADSRLSILQKYVLDANADCDVYGEELKTQAQNMAYQKIAATQLLQKKRLEFATNKDTDRANAVAAGKEKFLACVGEIYSCYETQVSTNTSWTAARIKNYCAQSAEVPSCYEEMVCERDALEVVGGSDSDTCANEPVVGKNTCRNIVLFNEITGNTGATAAPDPATSTNSKAIREACLESTPGVTGEGSVRDFGTGWGPGL